MFIGFNPEKIEISIWLVNEWKSSIKNFPQHASLTIPVFAKHLLKESFRNFDIEI